MNDASGITLHTIGAGSGRARCRLLPLRLLVAVIAASVCTAVAGRGYDSDTLSTLNYDSLVRGKIVTNAQMIGIGATNILDTYISPEKYSGTELRYLSHTVRQTMKQARSGRLSTLLVHQGYLSYSKNRAGEGAGIAGMYSFSYGMHYNWKFCADRLQVKAGAQVDGNLGFLYNTRNSNNPAQARVSIDIAPAAAASYRFKVGRLPMAVGYELSVPLVGLMFSPNYGQSYYEIFNEGNYDHNIVPTTIGCAPSLRQMLTIDFHLRHSALRIGYVGDVEQFEVNNLKYHNYSHIFMIGYVRRFKSIRLKP